MKFTSFKVSAGALALSLGVLMAPGAANAGFFEQLFGGSQPAPQPSFGADQPIPQTGYGAPADTVAPAEIHRRHAAAVDTKPVLQKTTDIMHDKTLRAGDPVMMKDGIHIYLGPENGHHSERQFVALDLATHVQPKERAELVAMDLGHRDPLIDTPLREGRSASDDGMVNGVRVSTGYRITDDRGMSIRYVGP